jgi:uncharacterized protein YidB (DUF937 family)
MGLLDALLGGLSGRGAGSPMLDGVLGMINQSGGIGGLAQIFRDKGLGGLMDSWISTGHNLPISADQIQQVLGNEQIAALATKLGIPHDQIASHLSGLLPQVIDKLTPGGQVPEGGALDSALAMLKEKLG